MCIGSQALHCRHILQNRQNKTSKASLQEQSIIYKRDFLKIMRQEKYISDFALGMLIVNAVYMGVEHGKIQHWAFTYIV